MAVAALPIISVSGVSSQTHRLKNPQTRLLPFSYASMSWKAVFVILPIFTKAWHNLPNEVLLNLSTEYKLSEPLWRFN